MWWSDYSDKPYDSKFKSEIVEAGKGRIGCEMNESLGWGITQHRYKRQYTSVLRQLWALFTGSKVEE